MDSKEQKPQERVVHSCGFLLATALAIRHLFGKVQREVAVIQQQQQGYEKKQTHEKIEYAISFTARILNIFHVSNSNCGDAKKSGKNIKPAEQSAEHLFFFADSECF